MMDSLENAAQNSNVVQADQGRVIQPGTSKGNQETQVREQTLKNSLYKSIRFQAFCWNLTVMKFSKHFYVEYLKSLIIHS